MAPRKSNRYSMSSNTSRGTSRSQTSNIAPAQLTERFRLLPSQWVPGLAPTYFVPPTGRIHKGIHAAPIMAQNLSDMWRSTFEISAAQLNSLRQNRTATASYPSQFALSEVTSHRKSLRTTGNKAGTATTVLVCEGVWTDALSAVILEAAQKLSCLM